LVEALREWAGAAHVPPAVVHARAVLGTEEPRGLVASHLDDHLHLYPTLQHLPPKRARAELARGLRSDRPRRRRAAALTAEQLGDESLCPEILRAAKRPAPADIQKYLVYALGRLECSKAEPLIRRHLQGEFAGTAARALLRLGERPQPSLVWSLLRSGDGRLRRAAAHALSELPYQPARARRLRRLARDSKSNSVRASIVRYHAGQRSSAAAHELAKLVHEADRHSATSRMPLWRLRFEAVAATSPALPIVEPEAVLAFFEERAAAFSSGIPEAALALARLGAGANTLWECLEQCTNLTAGARAAIELALSRLGDSRLRPWLRARIEQQERPSVRRLDALARLGVDLVSAASGLGLGPDRARRIRTSRKWMARADADLPTREGLRVRVSVPKPGVPDPHARIVLRGDVDEGAEVNVAVIVFDQESPHLVQVASHAHEPSQDAIEHPLPGFHAFESMRSWALQVSVGKHVQRFERPPRRSLLVKEYTAYGGYGRSGEIVAMRCRGEHRFGVTDWSGMTKFRSMPAGPCESGNPNYRDSL
jgi:hypothetical protein